MALNNTAKNLMLNALGAAVGYVALHTADSSGAEVSGGSPAYARKAITWNTAASGNLDSSNAPVFDVPGSTTVTHVGFWSDVTSGTFYGTAAVTSETFAGQGTYTLSDADVNLT